MNIQLRRAVGIFSLAVLAACGGASSVEILETQTGVTRQQYEAEPASARFAKESDDSRGETAGIAVEVMVKLSGYKGQTVPMDYTLHDARNDLPFVSRRVPLAPDSDEWSRRGRLWLPVHSAGTYYVRVVLGDSTGRKVEGPRTEDLTIQ